MHPSTFSAAYSSNATINVAGSTTFYLRGDDEPQDDGRGVREPRRPSPDRPPAAAALTLPVFED